MTDAVSTSVRSLSTSVGAITGAVGELGGSVINLAGAVANSAVSVAQSGISTALNALGSVLPAKKIRIVCYSPFLSFPYSEPEPSVKTPVLRSQNDTDTHPEKNNQTSLS